MKKTDLTYRSVHQHLSREEMIRYKINRVDREEKEEIEIHLSACQLCNDALNGIRSMDELMMHRVLKELRRPTSRFKQKKIFANHEWMALMAALFLIGFILFVAIYFFYIKK